MYLVWITPPINFTFSDDSVFLKKILAGDINSLNLLVKLDFECSLKVTVNVGFLNNSSFDDGIAVETLTRLEN